MCFCNADAAHSQRIAAVLHYRTSQKFPSVTPDDKTLLSVGPLGFDLRESTPS